MISGSTINAVKMLMEAEGASMDHVARVVEELREPHKKRKKPVAGRELISVRNAAGIYGVSINTMYLIVRNGEFRTYEKATSGGNRVMRLDAAEVRQKAAGE